MAYCHSGAVVSALASCMMDMITMCLSNHINAITIVLTDQVLGAHK